MDVCERLQYGESDRYLRHAAVCRSYQHNRCGRNMWVCRQAASTTLPGSRWGASAWVDAGGDLWLFGGWGLDSTATNGNGALNDFWVYVPNATTPTQPGTWTWVKGSNTGSPNGVYGDELWYYRTYEIWTPGGRSNATSWVDKTSNQLFLFGGEGYDSTSTTGNGYLNDLWRYLPYQTQ